MQRPGDNISSELICLIHSPLESYWPLTDLLSSNCAFYMFPSNFICCNGHRYFWKFWPKNMPQVRVPICKIILDRNPSLTDITGTAGFIDDFLSTWILKSYPQKNWSKYGWTQALTIQRAMCERQNPQHFKETPFIFANIVPICCVSSLFPCKNIFDTCDLREEYVQNWHESYQKMSRVSSFENRRFLWRETTRNSCRFYRQY